MSKHGASFRNTARNSFQPLMIGSKNTLNIEKAVRESHLEFSLLNRAEEKTVPHFDRTQYLASKISTGDAL